MVRVAAPTAARAGPGPAPTEAPARALARPNAAQPAPASPVQLPFLQLVPAGHTVLQAPQLLALVVVFTQLPLQNVGFAAGHTQMLF